MFKIAIHIDFHGRDRARMLDGVGDFLEQHEGVKVLQTDRSTFVTDADWRKADACLAWATDGEQVKNLPQRFPCVLNLAAHPLNSPEMGKVKFNDIAMGREAGACFRRIGLHQLGYLGYKTESLPQWGYEGLFNFVREQDLPPPVLLDKENPSLKRKLMEIPKPLGLLCRDDIAAEFLVQRAKKWKLRIPDEICLIGIGDNPGSCRTVRPSISSIPWDFRRLAFEGMEWILTRLISGQSSAPREIAPLPLVERETTNVLHIPDTTVREAVRYIHRNARRGIRVQDVADAVDLTRHALEKRYLRYLDSTPTTEIHRRQVDYAIRLLSDSEDTLTDIAAQSGFTSVRHMRRNFHTQEKKDPTAYRR